MKNDLLIGESGGSKTDWVLLSSDGSKKKSSSSSLHPSIWESYDWSLLLPIWAEMGVDVIKTDLRFFGAGCNSIERAELMKANLSTCNLNDIQVFGDLRAAGLATLNNNSGYTAILGSGSVLIDFRDGNVHSFHGGLGREKGDEGSGYYFGKMVLNDFFGNKLNDVQTGILNSLHPLKELDIKNLDDDLILSLARLLSENIVEFEDYHQKNMQLFMDRYVLNIIPNKSEISFVGSYAYFHTNILEEVCVENDFTCRQVIERPIDQLSDYLKKNY